MDDLSIMLVPIMICAFVYIVIGIANHGRREMIYAEYAGIFGPFKAYIFVGCMMGPALIISGILGFFAPVEISYPLSMLFSGIGMTALGVLIGWLTEKKAPGCRAVGYMFLAGLGTLWHIELIILKVLFIFWLIFKLFSRTRYDD